MQLKIIFSLLLFAIISTNSWAQVKVVIMGSSTAYGTGASAYSNSWAGKTEAFYNKNATDGMDTVFYNISFPGYDTYQEMPTGFNPPSGRPMPDEDYNVTKALSYNPDVVIINLPSNDINYGYSKYEMISNLRAMSSTIFAQGTTKCFVTTPQPRNDLDQAHRDSLLSLVDSVNFSFGPFAINFWDCLVTTDGLNMLKEEYRAAPSPIHVNDLGHDLLFGRVMNSHFLEFGGPLALQLTGFRAQAQNNTVLIKWHTEQQGANTGFELQRSADGTTFETIFDQTIAGSRQTSDYSTTDLTPFPGKSFYRIRINEAGHMSYSSIINITGAGKSLAISKLQIDKGASRLTAEINIQKSQFVNIIIVGINGTTLIKQKEFITQPGSNISIPIGNLPAGQYYIRILTADGNNSTNAFSK